MPPGSPGGIGASGRRRRVSVDGTPAVAVLMAHRGSLARAPLHRRPLFAHAVEAASAIGPVTLLVDDEERVPPATSELPPGTAVRTARAWWGSLDGRAALLHDALCPLTPAAALVAVADRHRADPGASYAGFRPVTDTVKTVERDRIVGTVDRDRLAIVASPVVVASALVEAHPEPPPLTDLAHLVAWIRARGRLELVRVPSMARRVEDEAAVHVLECVDEMSHRLRHQG